MHWNIIFYLFLEIQFQYFNNGLNLLNISVYNIFKSMEQNFNEKGKRIVIHNCNTQLLKTSYWLL